MGSLAASTTRSTTAWAKTRYLVGFKRRPLSLRRLAKPVVSLTFDDVPSSAIELGLPILDEFGVKATFYVCSDLHSLGPDRPTIGLDDVSRLSKLGHEIGCHTASHLALLHNSAQVMVADCQANRQALGEATNGRWPTNFSYPFGSVGVSSKTVLAGDYESLRSTRHGINRGRIDLNCLLAYPLYESSFGEGDLASIVSSLERRPGWCILYSHGIDDDRSLDVGSAQLRAVLQTLQSADIEIKTVDEVLRANGAYR